MIRFFRDIKNHKAFHFAIFLIIIVIILFFLGVIVLRYNVEGETNMPFVLTKISVVSQSEGADIESQGTRWAFDVNENNDIYIYIDKNPDYDKQELIKSVKIDSINIEKKPNLGETNFYRTDLDEENVIFKNEDSNKVDTFEYVAEEETDLKNMEISNQGGIIAFRYNISKIAEYTSDETEINHTELLKKANVSIEDLKSIISFNLTIILESGKEFQTTITLDLPIDTVVNEGVASIEYTDMSEFVFKRIQN